ncbi:hypothetical protein [Hymenobacter cavernae]|uniref:Copper resistance protein NlpE n=1 Tax=Hymenobacter cavernae TaxID=2044852 RepID=A0ABQ1TP08_9BACT|nr:hypothetical protein [Hymenobacter cavernae]GGE99366.1 hypothetical protein GCM10011383_07720 [Hymenobacter cavernae]
MKPILLLFIPLLLTTGCKKEKTELERLPVATQEGKNSAGFLLDGKAWLPAQCYVCSDSPIRGYSINTSRDGRILSLTFVRFPKDGKEGESLSFYLPHITKPDYFALDKVAVPLARTNPANATLGILKSSSRYPVVFDTGPDAVSSVTITRFDTVAHIVSGTFDLTVQEENGSETHQLTDGRFDLTLQ